MFRVWFFLFWYIHGDYEWLSQEEFRVGNSLYDLSDVLPNALGKVKRLWASMTEGASGLRIQRV